MFVSHLCCGCQFREREQGDLPLRIKFGENCWCFEMFKCHFGVKISQSLLWYKVYTQICKYKVPLKDPFLIYVIQCDTYIQRSSLFDDQQSASLSACGWWSESNDQQSAPPPGSDDHSNVEKASAGLRLPPRIESESIIYYTFTFYQFTATPMLRWPAQVSDCRRGCRHPTTQRGGGGQRTLLVPLSWTLDKTNKTISTNIKQISVIMITEWMIHLFHRLFANWPTSKA